MLKFQAQKSKNASGNLQLIIDTDNKIFSRGYYLTSVAVTVGTKTTLYKIIDELKTNGFIEKRAGYSDCYEK